MLSVGILGPVEVRRDGVRLTIPAGKTTEVLVRLALEAGVAVRADRLIEDLWSEQAMGVARNTLQSKVSRLRRALGDPRLITGDGAGYTLDVEPSSVDALEVLRLAESTIGLRRAGDADAAVRSLTSALEMFRGEILPAAGDGQWAAPFRARLAEARLSLTENRLAAQIELGAAGSWWASWRACSRCIRCVNVSGSCLSSRCTGSGARRTRSRRIAECRSAWPMTSDSIPASSCSLSSSRSYGTMRRCSLTHRTCPRLPPSECEAIFPA